MPFIPPMLATRLEDPRRLADPRYIAEPKLDGQRAQLHVRAHRTVHAFSRPGRELIRPPRARQPAAPPARYQNGSSTSIPLTSAPLTFTAVASLKIAVKPLLL